jgi:hypothetical protein
MQGRSTDGPAPPVRVSSGPGTAAAGNPAFELLLQEQAQLEHLQQVLAEQHRHVRYQQIALILAQQPDPSLAPALAQLFPATSAAPADETQNSTVLSLLGACSNEQDRIQAGARFSVQAATQAAGDRGGDFTPVQASAGKRTFAQMQDGSLNVEQPRHHASGATGAESRAAVGGALGDAHHDALKDAIKALMSLQQAQDPQAEAAAQAAPELAPGMHPEKRQLVLGVGSAAAGLAVPTALRPLLAAAPLPLSLSDAAVAPACGPLPGSQAAAAAHVAGLSSTHRHVRDGQGLGPDGLPCRLSSMLWAHEAQTWEDVGSAALALVRVVV